MKLLSTAVSQLSNLELRKLACSNAGDSDLVQTQP
jgi:hypothetical protein